MHPRFSIIIPALNEEKLLPRLLEGIKNQSFRNFEVILVDASSHDNTIKIAQSFKKSFPLTIEVVTAQNVSFSRNVGAKKAKGDYLFFIDADNYIPTSFLAATNSSLEKGYEMVIPSVKPDSKKIIHKVGFVIVNRLVHLLKKTGIYFSTGGNLIIQKTIFEKIHGFDDSIVVCEDHDLVQRAAKHNTKIDFSYKARVVFSVRRLEKEGIAVLVKYFISTVYIMLFGKITKKIYNYQMGGDYYSKKP